MTLARIIDGRSRHHRHHGSADTRDQGPDAWLGARDRNPPAEHPVVRIHPNTGEKCLDINPLMMSFIKELKPDESKDLLDFLYRKMIEPQFMVRWHWCEGSVAFWDSIATVHRSIYADMPDLNKEPRVMVAVTEPTTAAQQAA
jgi:alpha-ketoglutarate-dependent taurine dioxygenase